MAMSLNTKENIKLLIGGLISTFLVWFTIFLNGRAADEREQKRQLQVVYEYALTQCVRDSLRDYKIIDLAVKFDLHEKRTNDAIISIQQSLMIAKDQLVEADRIIENKNHN